MKMGRSLHHSFRLVPEEKEPDQAHRNNEPEKEPAFVRRKIRLDNIQHSSDTNISRTSLDNNNELRSGNSFLHDNVD